MSNHEPVPQPADREPARPGTWIDDEGRMLQVRQMSPQMTAAALITGLWIIILTGPAFLVREARQQLILTALGENRRKGDASGGDDGL